VPVKEVDLARHVVFFLQEFDWEVFQEVRLFQGGARADIVGKRDNLIRVVEVKTSLTAALVEQAIGWKHWAHYIHVAVPDKRQRKGRRVLEDALRRYGVGLLIVRGSGSRYNPYEVQEAIEARLDRKARAGKFRETLHDAFKNWGEAGNANHEYYSPWRDTCREWARYVKRNPGCTLKDLIENGHHYRSDASAKTSMVKWIDMGKVKGIRIDRDKKVLRLFPTEECE
jgi:hypothetical protein